MKLRLMEIGLMALGPVSAAMAADGLMPGAWELTRALKGGPMGARTEAETICFTSEELRADPALPLKMRPPADGQRRGPECTPSLVAMAGGKASYAASCKGPMGTIKADWTGTYTPTSFQMAGTMKMSVMSMKAGLTGRHVGACKAR